MNLPPEEMLSDAMGLSNGNTPFPWQVSLLNRFLKGQIPDALSIPTGLGKTSVMDIWLVARACGAKLPRRLVYIVDRRVVVDQATDAAVRLREFVDSRRDVRESLGLGESSLPVSTLRGQFVDNREWLTNPAWPAIIIGTVDMIGSRLLFQGYGVNYKMRSYHAGLLGADTLVVLDEAHLVPPFEHLLRSIAGDATYRAQEPECSQVVPRLRLMALSATGRVSGLDLAGLTGEDYQHPILSRRLKAAKRLLIHSLGQNETLPQALAQHAWRLAEEGERPVRVLIFADSREDVQEAKKSLEILARGDRKSDKQSSKLEIELLVGGRRVFEREKAKRRLAELGFLAGTTPQRTSPVFLFATSAGEVGVDLDADHMVCDVVAWERMVQRLGRVNRRGQGQGHIARIVVLGRRKPDPEAQQGDSKASEKSPRRRKEGRDTTQQEVWSKALEQLPRSQDGSYDASVLALCHLNDRALCDEQLRSILAQATSAEPLRPALNLPLVEAWSLTSLREHPGRPDIQPWLRGWVVEEPQTKIVWRKYLPVNVRGQAARDKEVEGFFEAAPPHGSEVLETETYRVADWLKKRVNHAKLGPSRNNPEASEAGGLVEEDRVVVFALNNDGSLRASFTSQRISSAKGDELKRELGGATLVVDRRLGGLRDGLLEEGKSDGFATADDGEWLGPGGVGFRIRRAMASEPPPRERGWREKFRIAYDVSSEGEPIQLLAVDKWRDEASMEDDRAEGVPLLLEAHEQQVERKARELAKAVGLPEELEEVLACAGRMHDEGKRSRRWQRAFRAPSNGVYAKTEGPIQQSVLAGYRHELGSVLRILQERRFETLREELRDLALHLVAAHHGFARPIIATDSCDEAPPSELGKTATEIALRFARLQKRWGPWGLAWWEALLRAADQIASREDTTSGRVGGGE